MFGRGRGRGSGPPIDSGAVIQEGIGRGGTGMGGGEFEHGGGPIHNTNSQQQSEPPAAGGFANGRGRGGGFGMGRGGLGISGGGGSLDNPPQSEPPAPGGFARGRGRGGIGNGRGGGGFGLSTGAIDSASGQQQTEPSAPAIGSFGRGGRGRGGAGIGRGVGEMTSEMAAEPAGDRNMGSVGFGGGRGRGGGPLFSGSNAAPISGNGRGSGGIGNGRGGFALSTGAIDSASGQQQSEPPAPAIGSFGRGGRGRGGAGIGRGVGEMTSEMAAEPAGDRNMGSMGFGGGRGRGGGPLFSGSNSAPISGNGRGRGGLNSGSTAESSFGTSRGGRGRGGREGNGSIHSGSQTFEESGPSRLRLGPNADTLGNPDSKSMGNPDAGYSAKHPTSSYVPSKRTIEELFNEDSAVQTLYMGIADSDDPVSTTVAGTEKLDKIEDWNEMQLHPKLLENIVDKAKYVRPRKIQQNVLPFVLKGIDVICLSETGSGKTGCYMIPIIQKILSLGEEATKAGHKITPTALIVFPTRELCLQVYEQGLKLASGTFIHVAKAFGEYNTGANIGELRRGCHILCATPGRLKDFIGKGIFDFSKLHFFVLDEADRMLEMGFADDIREILSTKGFPPKDQRQNLLFSATIPNQIQSLADEMVRADHVTASNSKPNAPNTRVDASFLQVEQDNKSDLLKELLEKEQQEAQAKDPANPEYRRTLVFVGTCRDANKLTLFLCEAGIQAQSVNSDRTQAERESTLNKFRKGEINVIVATDVMARGIDIKDLDLVVNYDMPNEIFTYIHRIGRTGRLKTGYAISFVNDQTDGELIKEITEGLRKEGKPIPEFWAGSNKQW